MVFMFSADRKRVVMTGFKPFDGDKINPSWEGVKSINARAIENKHDLTLFRKEIDVKYREVDKIVPQMWQYYQPHLTIHVGLNGGAESFTLEKKANKHDYKLPDNDNLKPDDCRNVYPGPDVACTTLDVDKICKEFNDCKRKLPDPKLRAETSDDAKKFLCEYIYYTSLVVGRSPSLFVHVPSKYTAEQIAQGLERILELCLEQLPNDINCSYELEDYSYHFAEQTQTINNNLLLTNKTSVRKMIKNFFSKKMSMKASGMASLLRGPKPSGTLKAVVAY